MGKGVNMRKPEPVQVDRGAVDTGVFRVELGGVEGVPLAERTSTGGLRAWHEGRPVIGRKIG